MAHLELDLTHPAVQNPWAAYLLASDETKCLVTDRTLTYVNASFDPVLGMWGDGVGANVDRSSPVSLDLDDQGGSMVFHVVLNVRVGGNFQTLCQIGFGGSDLSLRTGAAGNVRIQLLNVLGGSKTYDGALTVSTNDRVSYTGIISTTQDFYCIVVNHTTSQSVEITSTNLATGFFADLEEMNIIVQANISYIEFAYTGFAVISNTLMHDLGLDPYSILKSVSSGTTIIPDVGLVSTEGQGVSLITVRLVQPGNATVSVPGQDVAVLQPVVIAPSSASITVQGQDFNTVQFRQVQPERADIFIVGQPLPPLTLTPSQDKSIQRPIKRPVSRSIMRGITK